MNNDRDEFAARAMQSLILVMNQQGQMASAVEAVRGMERDIAKAAYNVADAMVDAGGQPQPVRTDSSPSRYK